MSTKISNRESPIEAKGNTGSITKDDIAQLLADLMEDLNANDEYVFLRDAIQLAAEDQANSSL